MVGRLLRQVRRPGQGPQRPDHPRPRRAHASRHHARGPGQAEAAFDGIGEMGGFDDVALQKYHWVEKINHVHNGGNSSGIVDGAALVLVGSEKAGKSQGLTPRARIVATATSGADPVIMLTGPTPATRKVLDRAGLTVDDIDLFELNEAFASVVLKFQKDLNIPDEKLNVNGGAIAMGHPLGATGAMITGTMVDELERRNARRALITLCIGGGMGVATIIEQGLRHMAENTIQWDKDADGIVTLTMDDPTGSANVMNEHYSESMHNAVERLVAEKDSITGVVITSAKKTFFAGGDLKTMIKAGPEDAGEFFSTVEHQGRPAHARDPRQARRRRHQRRRARRRPGDRAGVSPPHRGRRQGPRGRPARGHPRPAARRRRRHPHRADVRHPERVHERAVARAPGSSRPRPRRSAWSTSWSARSRNWCPPPRRGSRPTPRRTPSRGMPRATRCPAAPRRPPGAGRHPAVVPGAAAQAAQGCADAGAAGHPGRRRRGRAGRLRHRQPHREPLLHPAGHRPGREEHDPGVLLRPAGHQRRRLASRGHRQDPDQQDRRARRGHDGRRHRLRVGQGRLRRRAQGRHASRPRRRARATRRSSRPRRSSVARPPRRSPRRCSTGSRRPPTPPTSRASTS